MSTATATETDHLEQFQMIARTEQAEATCRCEECRRPLYHPVSVAAHRGPVCRARAGVAR